MQSMSTAKLSVCAFRERAGGLWLCGQEIKFWHFRALWPLPRVSQQLNCDSLGSRAVRPYGQMDSKSANGRRQSRAKSKSNGKTPNSRLPLNLSFLGFVCLFYFWRGPCLFLLFFCRFVGELGHEREGQALDPGF